MSVSIVSVIKSCPFLFDTNRPVETKVSTFLGKREVTFYDKGEAKTVDIEEVEKAFARAADAPEGFNSIVDNPQHKAALDRLVSLGKTFDHLQAKSTETNLISKLFRSTVTPTEERKELRAIQHDADKEIQFLADTAGLDDELFDEDFEFPGFSDPQLRTTDPTYEEFAIPAFTEEDTSSSGSSVSPRSSASSDRTSNPDVWFSSYTPEQDKTSAERYQRSFAANTQRYTDVDRAKTKHLDFKKEADGIDLNLRAVPAKLYRFYDSDRGVLNIDPKTGMYAPVPLKLPMASAQEAK